LLGAGGETIRKPVAGRNARGGDSRSCIAARRDEVNRRDKTSRETGADGNDLQDRSFGFSREAQRSPKRCAGMRPAFAEASQPLDCFELTLSKF
jgi:hypothetical protein